MRMRKKPRLTQRLEQQEALLISDPTQPRGRWRSLAPGRGQLWVELGCGKGRFTAETARQNPGALLVAVERVPDAMVIAVERASELGLQNVRFVDADAAALRDYFVPGEVDRIFLNFSDPWPSQKQAKRRLTYPDFLRAYARVLAPGGEIHFKTDNRDLFEWSLFQFPKAGFTLKDITRDLHKDGIQGVMTDYEEKFHREGKPICRCVALRGDTLSARLTLRPAGGEEFLALTAQGEEIGRVVIPAEGGVRLTVYEPYRRRGYGTELLGLALEHCRDELGLPSARIPCPPDDPAWARTLVHYGAPVPSDDGERFYLVDLTK